MRIVVTALMSVALLAPHVAAQSLLDRSPNVSGDWTGSPGTLYFHFIHRFTTSGAPERKVSNVPTFLLGGGLPKRLFAGMNYSTNSNLAPRFPNEWELFARWLPIAQDYNDPLDLGAQVGYNNAAEGVDAELSVARKQGLFKVTLAGRALADPLDSGHRQYAAAGGALIRLGTYVALAGDVASVTDRRPQEKVAWSAGLHLAIPLTPHTLSLQATNTLVNTLQGESRGTSDVRYGFEFTIPLTLRRYFGKRAETVAEVPAPDTARERVPPVARADTTSPAVNRDTAVKAVTRADTVAPAPVRADTARPAVAPERRAADTVAARVERPRARPAAPPPSPARRSSPASVVRTTIKNLNYLQSRIEVQVGTTVEWTNRDPLQHSVTADNGSFNSGLIDPSKTYRHTFTRPGTYNFHCIPHPFMKGTIVVVGGAP